MRRPKTNDDDDDANASSTHHHREGKERVVVVVDVVVAVVVVADRCAARATRSTARRISSKSVERLVLSLSFFSLQKNELFEILSGEKTTRNGLLSLFSHWYSTLQLARRELSRRALSLSLSLSLSLHEPFPLSPVLIVRRVKFVHARFVQPVRHRDAEYRDDPQRSRRKSKGLFDDFARVAMKLHELVGFDRRRVTSASRHSSLSLSLSLSGASRASFFYRNKERVQRG